MVLSKIQQNKLNIPCNSTHTHTPTHPDSKSDSMFVNRLIKSPHNRPCKGMCVCVFSQDFGWVLFLLGFSYFVVFFPPIWKICNSQIWSCPQIGVKINKCFKPPPTWIFLSGCVSDVWSAKKHQKTHSDLRVETAPKRPKMLIYNTDYLIGILIMVCYNPHITG